MSWLNLFVALFAWSGILILQIVLMGIARFFEYNAGERTWYQAYLVPLLLSTYGAGRYLCRIPTQQEWPDFVGDPIANLALFGAGISLLLLGSHLHGKMMGTSSL
ncbi:MAG: hypothetical protein ACP5GX_05035 [Anaerolineae bacterium]